MDHGDLAALLPEDVLAEVLRRVAAPRWLAMSRCVCKAWRAIIDGESLLRTELPFSGFFITFRELCLPEFFSRPVSPPGRPAISGKLDFLPTPIKVRPDGWSLDGDYYIQDHCNGLLLLDGYVVNPATRSWDPLAPCPPNHGSGIVYDALDRELLAFDPMVSSHYHVVSIHYLPTYFRPAQFDPLEEASEWPPSPYILHVFSSKTRHWEERSFVREGNAGGTVAEARADLGRVSSVYWRGSLYVLSQYNFITRISLSEDKYSVIKPPMGIGWSSYIGLSEKGVYCASFLKNDHILVCTLNETCNQFDWILKHEYDLKPVEMFDRQGRFLSHPCQCSCAVVFTKYICDISVVNKGTKKQRNKKAEKTKDMNWTNIIATSTNHQTVLVPFIKNTNFTSGMFSTLLQEYTNFTDACVIKTGQQEQVKL
uniref:F-box domain-containing protein n=1 Tax=Triticum aestivum TaxID=4565 RepID=A0A077RPB9_WHEAT|nr:unnamed protein product [Triticum aestivum]